MTEKEKIEAGIAIYPIGTYTSVCPKGGFVGVNYVHGEDIYETSKRIQPGDTVFSLSSKLFFRCDSEKMAKLMRRCDSMLVKLTPINQ